MTAEGSTAEPSASVPSETAAFGLRLACDFAVAGLHEAGASHDGCRASLSLAAENPAGRYWSAEGATRIGEERLADGSLITGLDRHPELGFRFQSPYFGEHLVLEGGRQILSWAPEVDHWMLERFVIGQLLPLSVVLQGLEAFHASAVVLGDHVIACVASAGTGKTSVGLQLLLRGAGFFADDVVAVTRQSSQLVCYPGSNVVNLRSPELERLSPEERVHLGRFVGGQEDRVTFEVERDPRCLPLGAIYFLDRSRDWEELSFVPPPDSRHFLACTYDTLTREPGRLQNLLDIAAQLAQEDIVRMVRIPAAFTAGQVADAIQADWSRESRDGA